VKKAQRGKEERNSGKRRKKGGEVEENDGKTGSNNWGGTRRGQKVGGTANMRIMWRQKRQN